MEDPAARADAEQLNLQAELRLVSIQANIKVYGGRDQWLTRQRSAARDAEIEQLARNGIEFVEAALKLFPDSPKYLNTYSLLLAEGLGQKKLALETLEKAAQLAPDDIQLKQNIRALQTPSRGCLVLCLSCALAVSVGYVLTNACYS